jgi:hypothetical protein
MKVLDLQCRSGHSFEGWFGSQDDYEAQQSQGLLTCPVCNDSEITKKLSAPRLNLRHGTHAVVEDTGSAREAAVATGSPATSSVAPAATQTGDVSEVHPMAQMQAALMHMVRHVMANTEDVGSRFAEEARKIHYGETEERNIRGQASHEETEALLEEGIEVLPLPVPDGLKGPLQ